MNSDFTKNALGWGKEGEKWLARIPSIIQEFEKKWSLKVGPPYPLSYNYVAPVVRSDGTDAVLKIGFPGDREFKTEIEALTIFSGDGAVKLLEADKESFVILLEKVIPGIPLSAEADDEKTTRILASVMKKLHKPLPSPHAFTTIDGWIKELSNFHNKPDSTIQPLPLDLVYKARELFTYLIKSSAPAVLVHGDLHHDNVLSSERAGWLAIDPKGIAAEPAYEVAAMIRNPYQKLRDIANLEKILRRRILILSEELGLNPLRIHQWCLAQTVLSAVWNHGEAKGSEHAIRVARALEKLSF
jgi:streptomycin 6-kinase